MSRFAIDQRVRILDGAFPGSPEERDMYAHGKAGTITNDLEMEEGPVWSGCYVVQIDNPQSGDDGNYHVIETELEVL